MTVFAYYRVSTDKQDFESQKFGVVEYAKRAGLTIEKEYLDDGVSGTVAASKRELGKLLDEMKEGDTIITGELSRLGRSTVDVIATCNKIAAAGVKCYMVKQGMAIDQTPMGKLMIAIFAAFAEMERDLISQRTRESLARLKAQGKKLGRKVGAKNKVCLMDKYADVLPKLIAKGLSTREIAKALKTSPTTVVTYLNKHPEFGYVKKKEGTSWARRWDGHQRHKENEKMRWEESDTARIVKKFLKNKKNTTPNTGNKDENMPVSGI